LKLYAFLMWLVITLVGAILVASAWTSDVCATPSTPSLAMAYTGGALLFSSILIVLPVAFRQLFYAKDA
jgi:hypothetical protein